MTVELEPLTAILPLQAAGKEPVVSAWLEYLSQLPRKWELLIVLDGPVELAEFNHPNVRIRKLDQPKGFGACLRTAIPDAQYPLVFYTAADYPYTPSDLGNLLYRIADVDPLFNRQIDLVSGRRTGVPSPALWSALGKAYRLFCRVALGLPVEARPGWLGFREHFRSWFAWLAFGAPLTDPHSAFKLFRKKLLDKFPVQSDGEFVHVELIAKATFTTCLMDELPLTAKPDRVRPPSWSGWWGVILNSKFHSQAAPVPVLPRPDASELIVDRMPRVLFVTGKLAEPSLRRVLADLAPAAKFEADVTVMPITVAALMTTEWIARHWKPVEQPDRVLIPGLCRGELEPIAAMANAPVERGPEDLRDLPEFFGKKPSPADYGQYDIEILAEINHAPRLTVPAILELARHFRASGADVIDLGCDPGTAWPGVADAVRALVADGFRVSIDSFNPEEVEAALEAGAECVLSVNGSNLSRARGWIERFPHAKLVAIPDTPSDLESLNRTADQLAKWNGRFLLDPILEPIGFGFTASLQRYADVRRRYPQTPMLMGIGNLTELTEVDSAGVNVLLAAICQELGIHSVLTTEVANWCRSAVKEFDLARRLVRHSVANGVLPKRLESGLLQLRDRKVPELGEQTLKELAESIADRNYRLFAERGELHIINGSMHLTGTDPFELFAELERRDGKLTPSHAFYLGYELAKAVTARTLGKKYTQDVALNWGLLTREETSHRGG